MNRAGKAEQAKIACSTEYASARSVGAGSATTQALTQMLLQRLSWAARHDHDHV